MQRCFQLATLGAGQVAPNPMVGAVLVFRDRIIGEGYHKKYGGPHAEVNCIKSVSAADQPFISQSTLYVSLEPCAHFGKTPPCTDLIIANKIPSVVIACRDGYEEVNGRGIEKLRDAGIEVTLGILEIEAGNLNKRFFTFHRQQRPYIILKWAQSIDGLIARYDQKRIYISNDYTNRLVHKWRSWEAGILVGTNTALNDDPELTVRLWTGNDPLRLVIDRKLKLKSTLRIFDGMAKTLVFNELKQEDGADISFFKLDFTKNILSQLLQVLYQLKILSVIVEGGSILLQSFIEEGLWDEARVITNKLSIGIGMEIGQGVMAPGLKNEVLLREEKLFTDTISYYLKKAN